ncbi:MAG: homoserine kinase [Methanomassiliicoccales archaeon]
MHEMNVVVVSPATLSNMGPGFDVFGLALSEPYDTIEARKIKEKDVIIKSITGIGGNRITFDPLKNSASIAASEVLRAGNADFGLELTIRKGIRPGSGIGSSGASAAGGAFVANLFLENPLPPPKLIECAARAEEVTSGGFHADNVAPAILGGFTVIASYAPLIVERVEPSINIGIVVSMPDVFVSTKDARSILPEKIELKKMVHHVSHACGLVLGMISGDMNLIGCSATDVVVEPARAHLIPYLSEVKLAAVRSGASAAFLSGSGPAVAAIYDLRRCDGNDIAKAMKEVYMDNGIRCDTWVTKPGSGCRRIG